MAHEDVPLSSTDLLTWMFDQPTYDADKPILIDAADSSRNISRRQARQAIRRIAAGLRQAGLRKGDTVCMQAFNDIWYSVACLGVVAAGGIYAGTNPAYTVPELQHYIRVANIKYWIVEPALLPKVRAASKKLGIPESHIFAFDVHGETVPKGIASWRSLQDHGEIDWERFDDVERSSRTCAVRLFSSGTTGLPKAMELSHYSLMAQHTVTMEVNPRPYEIRRLICNPMFHVSQVARVHTSSFRGGFPTYVMRRFELETWLANLEKYKISEIGIVPAMVISILQSGLLKKYSLANLKNVYCGSAPLDKDIQLQLKAHMPSDCTFNLAWGMSETGCVGMYYFYPEQDLTGAVGRPLPHHDAKLVDDDGREITTSNTPGELCMRGPSMFSGYFDGKTLTRKDYDDEGFFHTGDMAQCDLKTGLFYIVGRKKDLIKVRGFQVSPAEIEAALFRHPEVADVAVIGIQESAEKSELPRAYIVRKTGSIMTVEEAQDCVKDQLAKYKWLEGGVRFVNELPKNVNHKVMKHVLRDEARKEILQSRRENGFQAML